MNEEDEAFNAIERQAKQRKESVIAAMNKPAPTYFADQRAFPNPHRTDEMGMTLRDYFAAKAMQALVGRSDFEFEDSTWENAYDMADAMLKVREA